MPVCKIIGKDWCNLVPAVLAVIQDTEADTGLNPVSSMGETRSTLCVGYTIDMSVDLGNSSHLDVGNALQGFSVWTEEVPSLVSNWYL